MRIPAEGAPPNATFLLSSDVLSSQLTIFDALLAATSAWPRAARSWSSKGPRFRAAWPWWCPRPRSNNCVPGRLPGWAVHPSGPRSLALPTVNLPRPVIPPPPVRLKRLSELPDSGSVDLVVQVLKAGSPVLVWDGTVRDQLPTWCVAFLAVQLRLTLLQPRLFSALQLVDPGRFRPATATPFAPAGTLPMGLLPSGGSASSKGDQLIGGISEIWQVLD